MEQRCNTYFLHVDVLPPDSPFLSIVGRPLGAADDLEDAEECLRACFLDLFLDREQFAELIEEGFYAGHHHRAGNGRDIPLQGTPAHRLNEGQYAHGHDRVLQDQVGELADIDAIKVGAHLFQPAFGNAQNGQPVIAEQQCPRVNVG